jgi:hypothetical protein
MGQTAPVPPDDRLLAEAKHLLEQNTRSGELDGTQYRFTLPAADAYPFQWFWDSCFHAIVWAHIDRARAADELRSLLAWQRDDGFIPHVVFWDQSRVKVSRFWHYVESAGIPWLRRPVTSECVQPPVLAQAVERIGGDFAKESLPALARYYGYLARNRDPDGDGLVSIVNQFESGLDYSPAYARGRPRRNPLMLFLSTRRAELTNKLLGFDLPRIFRLTDHSVEDVLFNTIYADGLSALARIADDHDPALALWSRRLAARVLEGLLERCWDDRVGLFFNLVGRHERPKRQRAIISLLPLLLGDLPPGVAARLVDHLLDPHSFWTPYPVPSVPINDRTFRRTSRLFGFRFIWRGPASMNTNWFLTEGLRRHGYASEADELARRSRELAVRGGFNEFYDPLDGTPVGASDFGWATLAAII